MATDQSRHGAAKLIGWRLTGHVARRVSQQFFRRPDQDAAGAFGQRSPDAEQVRQTGRSLFVICTGFCSAGIFRFPQIIRGLSFAETRSSPVATTLKVKLNRQIRLPAEQPRSRKRGNCHVSNTNDVEPACYRE